MQHEPPAKAEFDETGPAGGAPGEGAPEGTTDESGADPTNGNEPEAPAEPTLDEQVAQWKDRAMRAAADLDNYRKRMAREKIDERRYANQALLEELLPVLDNFEMGLAAAASDKESMIFRGMEMVKKQLDDFLGSQGVVEVPAEGHVFDPNLHEAVSLEECPERREGAVLRVMRRGYRMHDRLLRPAGVVVAKAPETEAASGEEGDDQ